MYDVNKNFSISETVNRNIEKHQFPSFRNHKSLIGWCSMNYPRVLKNPLYMPTPQPREDPTHLDYLYQVRMKQDIETKFIIKKPFQNLKKINKPIIEEKIGVPPDGFKNSNLSLTTVKRDARQKIIEETNQNVQQYSNFLPISAEIPLSNFDQNFSRKIRQIGDIVFEPTYESEEIRHLKKLPNYVLTEQNLMEILNSQLLYLNLQNHTWIQNDLLNKIGYFAINLEEINLSGTEITDDILYEIGVSCEKLQSIDVSNCKKLTQNGIKKFLSHKNKIIKFFAAHNDESVNDISLEPLKNAKKLEKLNISFNFQISNQTIDYLIQAGQKFKELLLSNLEKINGDKLSIVLDNSADNLQYLDVSFMPQQEINKNIMDKIGNCRKLQQLVLTGSINIDDNGIYGLISGQQNVKKIPIFQHLQILKLGGLKHLTNGSLIKLFQITPNLQFLELNNLESITQECINSLIKFVPKLERVFLNFTPAITDAELQEFKTTNPHINFLRNINKQTDPKDDGLRMDFPLVNMKKPKKKKKKKK
ncbi:hypothetical protein IMG5_189420 [Ichthyophthirius multifiliis]|uniref:Leucine rich repeat protein n=1 Tax=Ichthyophthirius multifiliis TaxID=5932 RepID=G0R430_ICHMU|nr:hypothetical protein IMG5_189420 [Ichthyophthirius multifiliis]EGR27769.1 hypothetical protein IMG5_189420 [Ichthyophthirius multifiliis]|eukprot:XP_004026835.1 hypothetical protein IMG5_189420 [Ichthyophthirius multifiliis]